MAIIENVDDILLDLEGFTQARHSQIALYRETAFYYKNTAGLFLLYKPAGELLSEDHTENYKHPPLFIKSEDRIAAIKELQGTFTEHLKEIVSNDEPQAIKDTLVTLVTETLSEPRAGTLSNLTSTVDVIVEGFSLNKDVMKTLAFLSDNDYTTAIHVVNVMALLLSAIVNTQAFPMMRPARWG